MLTIYYVTRLGIRKPHLSQIFLSRRRATKSANKLFAKGKGIFEVRKATISKNILEMR